MNFIHEIQIKSIPSPYKNIILYQSVILIDIFSSFDAQIFLSFNLKRMSVTLGMHVHQTLLNDKTGSAFN